MDNFERMDLTRSAWLVRNGKKVPYFIEFGDAVRATARTLLDPVSDLELQQLRLDAARSIGDCSIPSLRPNFGIGWIAIAMGACYTLDEVNDPWVMPLMDENRIDLLDSMASQMKDSIGRFFPAIEKKYGYFTTHARYPIRSVNIPSPLVTASLLWEYGSFITAMMLYPEAVHRLLALVTDTTIALIKRSASINTQFFGFTHEPIWIPESCGIRISDDVAAVLTGDLYEEFGVPYNTRISEAFGGIVVHSCGDLLRVLPSMLKTEGLVGIDMVAAQNDMPAVGRVVDGKCAMCLRYFDWDFPAGSQVDLVDYTRNLVESVGRNGVMVWTNCHTLEQGRAMSEALGELLL